LGDARVSRLQQGREGAFLAASTDVGLSSGWLDLSSYQHPVLRNVYAVVLKKATNRPVEPESDEEKIGDKDKEGRREEGRGQR